jgi:hypothetical protein
LGFFSAGCARTKVSTSIAVAEQARVVVVNLSEYEWQISVTSQHGGPAHAARVAPRASFDLAVPAGDYWVEQTVLAAGLATDNSRRFPLRVAARQTYRWALATLLSDSNDEFGVPRETAQR